MKEINTTIEIERPPEDVFAFLINLDNTPLWAVGLLEVRHNGPLALGARGTDVRKMGRKPVEMPWEVTRYEPPRLVEFTYGDPFPATATFTFDRTPNGTRMTCETTLQLKGIYRLLAPVAIREARRTDAEQFQNAKELLEGADAVKAAE